MDANLIQEKECGQVRAVNADTGKTIYFQGCGARHESQGERDKHFGQLFTKVQDVVQDHIGERFRTDNERVTARFEMRGYQGDWTEITG